MPPEGKRSRRARKQFKRAGVPYMLLGLSASSWKVRQLQAMLDYHQVEYSEKAKKLKLMAQLHALDQELLRTTGRRLTSDDRVRILRHYGWGRAQSYDRHMAEVLRYDVNYGNHDGDLEEFPYVEEIIGGGPGPENALRSSAYRAIESDYAIYKKAYEDGDIKDLEDDDAFAKVYKRARPPQRSYSAEERDHYMGRFLARMRAKYFAWYGMEKDEEEEDEEKNNDKDKEDEDEENTEDEDEENTDEESEADIDEDEESKSTDDEIESTDSEPESFPIKTWSRTSSDPSAPIDRTSSTPTRSQPAQRRSLKPNTSISTSHGYSVLARGRCPQCSVVSNIIRESYHVSTICQECRHSYCWDCKVDWAQIATKGRRAHAEACYHRQN